MHPIQFIHLLSQIIKFLSVQPNNIIKIIIMQYNDVRPSRLILPLSLSFTPPPPLLHIKRYISFIYIYSIFFSLDFSYTQIKNIGIVYIYIEFFFLSRFFLTQIKNILFFNRSPIILKYNQGWRRDLIYINN